MAQQKPTSTTGSSAKKPAAAQKDTAASIVARLRKANNGTGRMGGADIRYRFSTTLAPLDLILSGEIGSGFPSGRISEVYGDEHVGKSTLCCMMLAAVQRANGVAIFADTEATMTTARARELGINTEALVYIEEEFVEPILDSALALVREFTTVPGIAVWDTVAGTASIHERDRDVGESGARSPHARSISLGFRKLSIPLSQSNMAFICVNQLKEGAVGKLFATERDKEATLGGKAMRFHSHVRLRLRNARKLRIGSDERGVYIGDEILATCIKHKEMGSGTLSTQCVLVLRKVPPNPGQFSAGLSVLRTLQKWGAFKGGIAVGKQKFTALKFEERYSTDAAFRESMNKMLSIYHASVYQNKPPGTAKPAAPAPVDDEEETMPEED